MAEIKAVIFDWGGVLIDDPTPVLIKRCSEALAVSEMAFAAAQDKHLPEFDTGRINEETFWQLMSEDLKVPAPEPATLWSDTFRKYYSPRTQVFAWAKDLQGRGYMIGLLSNTEPPNMKFFLEQKYTMFNFKIFSCAVGTRKPGNLIYEKAIQQAMVTARTVLYLDDREKYVEAARRSGMQSERVRSTEEVKQALQKFKLPIA